MSRYEVMHRPHLSTAIFGIILAFPVFAAAPQPPQLRLPDTAAPTSYEAHLQLDPAKPTFSGEIRINLDIKKSTDLLWLNATKLNISQATLTTAGKTIHPQVVPGGTDFVGFQFPSQLPTGRADLTIAYTGQVRQQDSSGVFHMKDNGNDYIYTQFESTDARDAFPCFDEPSYKVPWQLTLSIPAEDSAVSNTSADAEPSQGGQKVYRFRRTKPLPSYLVAFAVGQFDFVNAGTAGRNHIPVRIVTPKGHADEAKYAAEITATIITREEEYFGIPFPYDKSDQVAIPVTFGFGAMENAGMVTYAQNIILARPKDDTDVRQREYASVAAHELAHQWFGDLVTTAWWNDIWLNEAFATWMEQKTLAEWKPEWKTRVEDVSSKLGAEAEDRLLASRKIRQEIKSKDDISNAFDGITYQKGAAVIRMFENWMGPEQFRKGVHSYLTQYAFRNATAPEFLDAVSSGSPKKITAPFTTFLTQAGVPLVSVSLECKNGSSPALHLEQQRSLPLGSPASADQLWQIPVCYRYGSGVTGQHACTLFTQRSQNVPLQASACPAWVQANDNAVGYYQVNYRNGLLSSLASGDVEQRLSAPERVDFIGNARSLASDGKIPMGDALGLVQTFHNDPERHVIEGALDLALAPRAHLVPENLIPNYQRFLQQNFGPKAHQLGWVPQPGESDDVKLLRPFLVGTVATTGGDQQLARTAEDLTRRWLSDQGSIAPNMLTATLRTAAYYGNKQLFDQFLAKLQNTKDRQLRTRMLRAMQGFRDPDAIRAGMDAVLSGKIPMIEGGGLLFAGQDFPATREMSFDFLKTNFAKIVAERPTGGGFDFGAYFPRAGAEFCTATQRQQLADFLEPRVQQLTGAPRALKQVLESVNVCIAEKSAQEPSVIAFLKKF